MQPSIPSGALTPQQISQARASLTAPTSTPGQNDSFGIGESSPQSPASQVVNNLENTFTSEAQNIKNDIGNAPNLANQAGGSPTAKIAAMGSTVGHVAGDVAGTAGGILGSFIAPLLPNAVKNGVSNISKTISDKVNSIPGMTPEIAKSLGDVFNTLSLEGGAKGEAPVTGAIKSGAESVGEAVNDLGNKLTPVKSIENPIDTLSSRIKDTTPDYNKEMVGTNVKTPDTIDAQGNKIKGQITPRISGEGQGLNGERPVTTSSSEHAAGTELNNIKDYPDKGTHLEKMLSTEKSISNEAEGMRSGLQAEDKAKPLNTTTEKSKVANLVGQHLPENIQSKIGILSPEDEAHLKAMQTKLGAPMPEGGRFDLKQPGDAPALPKTAAGKYYGDVIEAVKNYDGTREGKLDLRQQLDSAYKTARGKLAFGSDSSNSIDEIHTDIRNDINKDLAATTKDTDTQASLKRQTNLYRAHDVLTAKARAESATAFGRLEQKYPTLKTMARTAQRQGVMLPLRIIEGAAGIGLIGTFLRKAISGK